MKLNLTSPAFSNGGEIPAKYTCEGEGLSPLLAWSGVPGNAKSLALVVDDPDAPDPAAPKRTWVHWVLYNIPPDASPLGEGTKQLPGGALEGLNDWQRTGYDGPCPPAGRHRYFHKLYALDTVLPNLGQLTKDKLEAAMRPHILGHAEFVGTYRNTSRGCARAQSEEAMPRCEVCGNDYDKTLSVTVSGGAPHVFDSFECAIQALAPHCSHCDCHIIGHGVEAHGKMFCCAHCARQSGEKGMRDRD